MKKKGFTLIELLAVIVILAIIAVIAIPTILGVVEKARKEAAKSSALGYIDAVEKQIMINQINDTKENILDGTYQLSHQNYKINNVGLLNLVENVYAEEIENDIYLNDIIKVKGKKPTKGFIVIEKGKVSYGKMIISGYDMTYDITTTEKIVINRKVEANGVDVNIDAVQVSDNTIEVIFSLEDNKQIKSATCEYGTTRSYGNVGTIKGNKCIINYSTETSTTYYYKIDVKDTNNKNGYIDGSEKVYNVALSDDNPIKQEYLSKVASNKCKYINRIFYEEGYTGKEETYTTECPGNYKLEVWGAQGGGYNATGGYGAYSVGTTDLVASTTLHINVGGQGKYVSSSGAGYNGGGNAGIRNSGAGGGATHIALVSGLLKDLSDYKGEYDSTKKIYISNKILIVAGGGGGTGCDGNGTGCVNGASAGGYIGSMNTTRYGGCASANQHCYGGAGTQSEGGVAGYYAPNPQGGLAGDFGQGGNGKISNTDGGGGGGGGGFFGGGGAAFNAAGGGSGYIGNPNLTNKHMTCYNCSTSDDAETKTQTTTNVSDSPIADYAKTGAGYVRITYLGK